MDATRYSIGELAEKAGITRRTVRFYVQRGLIPLPLGRGRGEHYTGEHLTAVLRVKSLQEQGASLDDIRRYLKGDLEVPSEKPAPGKAAREKWPRDSFGDAITSGPPKQSAWWDPRPFTFQQTQKQLHWQMQPGQVWIRQVVTPGLELHALGRENAFSERQLAALAQFINELRQEGGNDEG